jgi:hypothetical protein
MDATGGSMFSAATRTTQGRSVSSGPRLSARGLVTCAPFFTGGAPGHATLRDLSAEPDFQALEARQRGIVARRIELLKRQAAKARETHGLLGGADGLLHHARRHVNDTKHAISYAQRRGIQQYYQSPPRVSAAERDNVLGSHAKEQRDLEAEIQAGHEEERLVVKAMANLNVGAVEGRGPRAGRVTNLATWRSVYGNPAGHLATTSPGYATEWRQSRRMYGGPNSPLPHGHKRLQLFASFASSGVDMRLGRDLK